MTAGRSSDEIKHERDIQVAAFMGRIDATLTSIDNRMSKVETDLTKVVGTVNRWKGATAILVVVGGVIGWLANLFVKGTHA